MSINLKDFWTTFGNRSSGEPSKAPTRVDELRRQLEVALEQLKEEEWIFDEVSDPLLIDQSIARLREKELHYSQLLRELKKTVNTNRS